MKKTLLIVMILSLLLSTFGCTSSTDKIVGANYVAAVKDKDSELYGYIDETGEYVIEPQFVMAWFFAENGLASVQDADSELYGYIDETGGYVIEPQFDFATDFAKVN